MPSTSHDAHNHGHGAAAPSGATATPSPGGHPLATLAVRHRVASLRGLRRVRRGASARDSARRRRPRRRQHEVAHVDGPRGHGDGGRSWPRSSPAPAATETSSPCRSRRSRRTPTPTPPVRGRPRRAATPATAPRRRTDRTPARTQRRAGHEHVGHDSLGAERAGRTTRRWGMAHGGHDMSDPRMAAAMEADMRRRFWISLVLAIPVVLYSPMATDVRADAADAVRHPARLGDAAVLDAGRALDEQRLPHRRLLLAALAAC